MKDKNFVRIQYTIFKSAVAGLKGASNVWGLRMVHDMYYGYVFYSYFYGNLPHDMFVYLSRKIGACYDYYLKRLESEV